WGVNCNSDVDIRVVSHFLGLRVVRSVDVRVRNQSLNGCLHDDWQEGQVSAVLIDECWLSLLAKCCHRRHIDFLDVGELRSDVQRFHHLGSRDFTDSVDLGRGANQFLLGWVNRLRRPVRTLTSWCSRTRFCSATFRSCQDILLANTSAYASAFNSVEIDAVLVRQLTHERGDVRNIVAGVDLGRRLWSRLFGLRRSCLLRLFLLRLRLLWLSLWLFLLRSFLLWLCLWFFLLFGSCWLCVAVADAGDD